MNINEVKLHRLYKKLSGYDRYVLYGAGYMAKRVMNILNKVICKPLFIVVTNLNENIEKLYEIPVYDLDNKISELQKNNVLVIIAVTDLYEEEIVDTLNKNNINNYILASQYFWDSINEKIFWNLYWNKEFDWYVSRMKEWYFDQFNRCLDVSDLNEKLEKNNRIIFVIINFSPRVIKILKAIKTFNRNVIVFLDAKKKGETWNNYCNILKKENIEPIFFSCIEELLFLLLKNKGKVLHIFSNPWEPYVSYILVKMQGYIGNIVFENYDIANGFYTIFKKRDLELEQYCLENAKGICYREFSLEYLINVLQFKICGKTFRFFDYCSDEDICYINDKKDKELSICYVGGVITEDEYPDCPFGGFMEIAKKCEKNRCHLHIYPAIWNEKLYEKYIKKDKESVYFHFHKTIPYNELINEISQYDYGIMPAKDGMWDRDYSGYNTKYKYIYAAANKYFDYLDAGLPIIAALPLKFVEFLEKEEVLINWMNGQYDFQYLLDMREILHKNVMEVREKLKIGKQIKNLIEFYDTLDEKM